MRLTASLLAVTALCAAAFAVAPRSTPGDAVGPAGEYRVFASGVATSSSPRDYQALSAEYAERLISATSDAERYAVLLDVMETARVGVYSPLGERIVQGAERRSADFYTYIPELQLLAGSLGRGDRWDIESITRTFAAAGMLAPGSELTAGELASALHGAAQAGLAANTDPPNFFPLLARELGLRHEPPYDLAAGEAIAAGAQLDALQRWLLITDIAIGAAEAAGLTTAPIVGQSRAAETSGGVFKRQEATGPTQGGDCINIGTPAQRLQVRTIFELVKSVADWVEDFAVPIDLEHTATLMSAIIVREKLADGNTHYGHEQPGAPIRFQIEIEMTKDLGHLEVNCGWLAGLQYPAPGKIPGVDVDWVESEWEGDDMLARHGSIQCGVLCTRTDDDGIATFVFQPKAEQAPYSGFEIVKRGVISAYPKYITSLGGGIAGRLVQFATVMHVSFPWEVGRHAKEGWTGTARTTYRRDVGGDHDFLVIDAVVTWEFAEANFDGTVRTYRAGGNAEFRWEYVNPGVCAGTATGSYPIGDTQYDNIPMGHTFLEVTFDSDGQAQTYRISGETTHPSVDVDVPGCFRSSVTAGRWLFTQGESFPVTAEGNLDSHYEQETYWDWTWRFVPTYVQ